MSSENKRALIVDVDPALLGVVERLLETEGWDTTTTWDMNEAIASLRSRRFDLVIAVSKWDQHELVEAVRRAALRADG